MKKKLFLLPILFIFIGVLSGCDLLTLPTGSDAVTTTTSTTINETIDYSKIASEVYRDVYSIAERDLYSQLYSEIKSEFIDGTISTESLQEQIYEVIDYCKNGNLGVVNYKTNDNNEQVAQGTGSGVVYDKETVLVNQREVTKYYIITNHHVIENGTSFKVQYSDETYEDATLIGSNATTDLALLYFYSVRELNIITLGDSDEAKVGEFIVTIGNPKGETLYGTVNFGIIGGKNRNLIDNTSRNTINEYIQHDAAINPGNSGGGLYNLNKECIGINSVKYSSTEVEGLNFAIPSNLVIEVIKEIRETGVYKGTVKLGVSIVDIANLTSAGRTTCNVPSTITSGVVIAEVTDDGSAYGYLNQYDIIYKIEAVHSGLNLSKDVTTTADLLEIVHSLRIDDTIKFYVYRSGEPTTVEFVLTK